MTYFTIQSGPINIPELQKFDAFVRPTDYAILNGATADNCIRPIIKAHAAQIIKPHITHYATLLDSTVFHFGKIPQFTVGSVVTELADEWYGDKKLEKSTYANVFDVYQFAGELLVRTTAQNDGKFSDGRKIIPGENYWCRVGLIDWFEDPHTGNWISVSPLMPNTMDAKKQLQKLLRHIGREYMSR